MRNPAIVAICLPQMPSIRDMDEKNWHIAITLGRHAKGSSIYVAADNETAIRIADDAFIKSILPAEDKDLIAFRCDLSPLSSLTLLKSLYGVTAIESSCF